MPDPLIFSSDPHRSCVSGLVFLFGCRGLFLARLLETSSTKPYRVPFFLWYLTHLVLVSLVGWNCQGVGR
ncbi:hypothetical protein BDW71DRAFT_184410 [Aspergillus fruticulosus]